MRKLFSISRLFSISMCVIAALAVMLTGCSSGNDDMYEYVPGDNMMVLSVSVDQILKSAGCEISAEGVKLTPEMQTMMKGASGEFFKLPGIDPKNVIVTLDVENNTYADYLMLVRVTDKAALEKFLVDAQAVKDNSHDGFDVYKWNGLDVLIKDKIMIGVTSTDDPVAVANKMMEKANKCKLAQWQIDKLEDGNALTMIINHGKMAMASNMGAEINSKYMEMMKKIFGVDLSKAYSVMETELDGNKLKGEAALYEPDGSKIKIKSSGPAIDTSLLKYTTAADQALIMLSMTNGADYNDIIKEMLGNSLVATEVSNLLASINGTVMIAGGIDNIQTATAADGMHGVIVAQMYPGKAQTYVSKFDQMLGSSTVAPDGTKEYQVDGMKVYAKVIGDDLVISLGTPVTDGGGSKFKADKIKGKNYVMMADVPANTPAVTMVPLPFNPQIYIAAEEGEADYKIELAGSDVPFLQQILNFVASF